MDALPLAPLAWNRRERLLAVLVVCAFGVMLVTVSDLQRSADVQAQARGSTSATLEIEELVDELAMNLRAYFVSGNERFQAAWRRTRGRAPAAIQGMESQLASQPAQHRQAVQLSDLINGYIGEYGVPLIAIFHDSPAAARAPVATREGLRRITAIRIRFDHLLTSEAAIASADTTSARNDTNEATVIAVAAVTTAVGLLALYGIFLARGIARPVRVVADGATRVAAGDLSTRLPEGGAAEIHSLTSAFNVMARSLEQGKREHELQNEQLRQSERQKSQLVSIVSHELRNPLTSILGYTSLLLKRDFDRAHVAHYLEIIQQQGNRLSSLIDHFLESETVESGRFELKLEALRPEAAARGGGKARLGQDLKSHHRGHDRRGRSARARRPGTARPGLCEPARQRSQVLAGRRPRRGRRRDRRRARHRARERPGDRRSRTAPVAALYEILPGRGTCQRNPRDRARPGGVP